VDLIIVVLIELFSLGVTADALRAKIDRKSAISLQRGQFDWKFQVEELPPSNHFRTDIVTTLSLTLFTQRNFVADFLQAKCHFIPKLAVLCFCASPLGRGNVRWSS